MNRTRLTWLPACVALCVLGAAVIARACFGIPWRHMMGDPAAITGWPFYLGFVSNAGALLWAAGASIFLFSYYVHRTSGGDAQWGRFLLCSALFVGLLGLDDMFMLHDEVIPDYTPISQTLVVASYAGLAALYVVRFAPLIAQTAYPVFVAAIALLAFSAGIDQIQDRISIVMLGKGFWEDAAKLLGIATWLSYAVHTSAAVLRRERAPAVEPVRAARADLGLALPD
ncbi:MAG TPA: hypothetical protein VGX52_18850 [Burkholderiales bacterium]|nr:hypothetical protein [Burkholderiales bacterium]